MKTAEKKEVSHSEQQAAAQLESILEMVAELERAEKDGTDEEREKAQTRIQEDPLEVSIRSGWCGSKADMEPEEYKILLCTGGPACRIVGSLDRGQPDSARIEHQDWGTPWTTYYMTQEQEEAVLTYCRCFYFGE